uniref:Clarin-1 n=1 Tax=Scophthalmus maximus TaxID=52904 RepID=A0A8D3DWL5_SCOMX
MTSAPPSFRPATMPSRQKQLIFSISGLLGLSCALTAAVATGLPFWLDGTVLCRTGAELVNATGPELDKFLGEVSYGLFHGHRVKQCGLGGRASRFSFFPDLLSSVPAGLHVSVIFLCGAVILFSSVATGFFFFNAFGRPYETLQGPMGLYLWTFICCVCSSLIMILFASEVKLHHLTGPDRQLQRGQLRVPDVQRALRPVLLALLPHLPPPRTQHPADPTGRNPVSLPGNQRVGAERRRGRPHVLRKAQCEERRQPESGHRHAVSQQDVLTEQTDSNNSV